MAPDELITARQLGFEAAVRPARDTGRTLSTLLAFGPWMLPVLLVAIAAVASVAGATQPYAAGYPVDPRIGLLFAPALGVSLALYLIALPLARKGGPTALVVTTSVLAVGLAAWACAELIGHRASGATGSDPYAYAQMAVDLVRTGTVLHRFELLTLVLHPSVNLSWDPLVHIGYHLPVNEPGDAPTVWPVGAALPLALGYLVGGKDGLFWVNPIATFGAAAATGLLAWMLVAAKPKPVRLAVGVLAGAIILTSNEQVLWGRVPMADAQAELLTTLAFVAALWAGRQASFLPMRSRATAAALVLAGAMLGAAYLVRHTQVLIAASLAILIWPLCRPERREGPPGGSELEPRTATPGSFLVAPLRRTAILFGAALLVALPDFWYRQQSLGGWLRPESEELRLFSSAALLVTPDRLWSALTRGDEFGWLLPLIAAGVWRLARDDRRVLLALLTWLGVVVAFHLPYPALRLRDLVPEFPVLTALAAIGTAWVVESVRRTARQGLEPSGELQVAIPSRPSALPTFSPTLPSEGGGNTVSPRAGETGTRSGPREGGWWAQLSRGVLALCLFLTIDALVLRFWSEATRPFDPPEHVFGYLTQEHRKAFEVISALVPAGGIVAADFNDGALDLLSGRATVRAGLWTPWERHLFFCRAESRGRPLYVLDDSQAIEAMVGDLRAQGHTMVPLARFELPVFPGEPPLAEAGHLWRLDFPCGA